MRALTLAYPRTLRLAQVRERGLPDDKRIRSLVN